MARSVEEFPGYPAVVVNPDDNVTREVFAAWLNQLQTGEPVELPVTAAKTLAEARAAGEV